jgi:putative transposase
VAYDPDKHHRRSIRLQGYDYAQAGAYFLTICAYGRECLFGEVVNGAMLKNDSGRIVEEEWLRSAEIRQELELDVFVVMPNHLHGIVFIMNIGATGDVGATSRSPLRSPARGPAKLSLGSFVSGFKSACTKRVNEARGQPGTPMWQRGFYERVIRSEEELERIRAYVLDNPARWATDEENPDAQG